LSISTRVNLCTDKAGIGAVPLPSAMAQDHDRLGALPLLLRQKGPPIGQRHTQDGEVIGGDEHRQGMAGDVLAPECNRLESWVVRHQVGERRIVIPQVHVGGIGKGPRDVAGLAKRQLLGIFHLRWAKEQHVDRAEHDRIGPDADRQRNQRNRRKARRLSQHANTVPQILPQDRHCMTPGTSWNNGMVE
jgi:hypothetical protein